MSSNRKILKVMGDNGPKPKSGKAHPQSALAQWAYAVPDDYYIQSDNPMFGMPDDFTTEPPERLRRRSRASSAGSRHSRLSMSSRVQFHLPRRKKPAKVYYVISYHLWTARSFLCLLIIAIAFVIDRPSIELRTCERESYNLPTFVRPEKFKFEVGSERSTLFPFGPSELWCGKHTDEAFTYPSFSLNLATKTWNNASIEDIIDYRYFSRTDSQCYGYSCRATALIHVHFPGGDPIPSSTTDIYTESVSQFYTGSAIHNEKDSLFRLKGCFTVIVDDGDTSFSFRYFSSFGSCTGTGETIQREVLIESNVIAPEGGPRQAFSIRSYPGPGDLTGGGIKGSVLLEGAIGSVLMASRFTDMSCLDLRCADYFNATHISPPVDDILFILPSGSNTASIPSKYYSLSTREELWDSEVTHAPEMVLGGDTSLTYNISSSRTYSQLQVRCVLGGPASAQFQCRTGNSECTVMELVDHTDAINNNLIQINAASRQNLEAAKKYIQTIEEFGDAQEKNSASYNRAKSENDQMKKTITDASGTFGTLRMLTWLGKDLKLPASTQVALPNFVKVEPNISATDLNHLQSNPALYPGCMLRAVSEVCIVPSPKWSFKDEFEVPDLLIEKGKEEIKNTLMASRAVLDIVVIYTTLIPKIVGMLLTWREFLFMSFSMFLAGLTLPTVFLVVLVARNGEIFYEEYLNKIISLIQVDYLGPCVRNPLPSERQSLCLSECTQERREWLEEHGLSCTISFQNYNQLHVQASECSRVRQEYLNCAILCSPYTELKEASVSEVFSIFGVNLIPEIIMFSFLMFTDSYSFRCWVLRFGTNAKLDDPYIIEKSLLKKSFFHFCFLLSIRTIYSIMTSLLQAWTGDVWVWYTFASVAQFLIWFLTVGGAIEDVKDELHVLLTDKEDGSDSGPRSRSASEGEAPSLEL